MQLILAEKELTERNIKYFKLTGSTKVDERIELVDEFNQNPEIGVFLISLKAGGTGLNLVGADMVIHYDPWWNISAQNQIPQDEVVAPQEEIKEEELNPELLSDENEVFDFEKMGDNIPFKEELIEEEDDFFAPDLKDVADDVLIKAIVDEGYEASF